MTTEDIRIANDYIDSALSCLYKKSCDLRSFPEEIRTILTSATSIDQKKTQLESLRANLTSLEKVVITLPFTPDKAFIAKLYTWFKNNVQENIVLELHENEELLGGFEMVLRGKFYNFSLSKKLDDYFGTCHVLADLLPN